MPALVTIAIPIAPRQRWLDVALQSIFYQDFVDWEIAAVLDGHCETNAATLRVFEGSDRLRVTTMPAGSGVARCLNVALQQSDSEFVARMDADDLARPDRLGMQVAFLRSRPNVAVVGTWAQSVDEDGRIIGVIRPPTDEKALRRAMLWRNCLIHPSVLARRSVIEAVGGYEEACARSQDYELWLRILATSDLANIGEYATMRRIHSSMHSKSADPMGGRLIREARLAAVRESRLRRPMARFQHELWMWHMRRVHGA